MRSSIAGGVTKQSQVVRVGAPALTLHWPEYLIEATCLGLFMISLCAFGTLFFHPASPLVRSIPDPTLRRIPMGLAMALTVISLVYSPMGMRSGAHMNPSMTIAFFHLRKVVGIDAIGYIIAQFVGGIVGVIIISTVLGTLIADPAVNYLATLPGASGAAVAWLAELVISCLFMLMVLSISNSRFARVTGLCAGALLMIYIIVEAPLSGMSLNPARSLGSAVAAHTWSDL